MIWRAALVFAAAWPLQALAQNDVPQWSVHEIPLTAVGSHKNPYTDVTVTATFNGPGGAVKTVKGFWDGGRAFKVRFTPDRAGAWTYSIVASPTDAGLVDSGTITATAPVVGNHGFLRVDAANPYSFVWDDGTRHFMFGQTYYDVMLNVAAGGGWKTAVDNSAAHGLNKIRLHVYPLQSYGRISPTAPVEETTYPQVIPYGGTNASPNRDQLNIPFWRKLDEYVKYLDSKGVIADLILFNAYVKFGANQWGTQTQDERFVRYALARYGAFHNVIWCVSNEWAASKKPQSYIDTLGSMVRKEDPWIARGSFLRALSVHQNTRIDFQFFGSSWPTHAIIQYGIRNKETAAGDDFQIAGRTKYHNGDEWGNAGIIYNLGHKMPVVNDEFGYLGDSTPINLTQTQHRWAIWGIAAAGGYISIGDNRRPPTGTPEISGDWLDAPEYDDIQRLVDFFTTKGLEHWKMSSQNSLKTSGTRVYVLAETGRQYLIYATVGGTFSVNVASGTYMARRYNPRTGEDATLAELTGGGSRSFTLPDANDWVVYLKAKEELGVFGDPAPKT
ncbi:MAG: DUF5060 domain-containing protein [Acidobacteria bacterium]|nr:DUF5060 domain-containing protein [Acidobacteriota bacterium]